MASDPARYDLLIEHIYDAALKPDGWDGIINEIAAHFNSEAGGFYVQTADQHLGYFRFIGMSDGDLAFYDQHIAEVNPWYQVPGLMAPGKILTDSTLETLHKDRKAFVNSTFHSEWCSKLGLRHCIGGTLLDHRENHLNFTFFRPQSVGHFSNDEVRAFTAVSRHMGKAVELNARLEVGSWLTHISAAALDRLAVSLIIVDNTARIEFSNRAADQLLRAKNGVILQLGKLRAQHNDSHQSLLDAIHKTAYAGGHTFLTIPRPTGSPLAVYLTANNPAQPIFPLHGTGVTIFIVDPDVETTTNINQLSQQWGFNRKEAEFAQLLLQGHTVNEAAGQLLLTRETGRWYCKRIMEKVGVRRQAELMIKLLRGSLMREDDDTTRAR